MLNEIIKGISMALNAAFGDGYEIYQNDVEQGLKEPCFLIAVLQPEITPMLGRRFIKRNPFDIQYFPTNPRNNAEMFTVAETMMEALDFITLPSGDLLHGTSVNYEIVDNTKTITGTIDEVRAVEQAVFLILNVERYEWLIYSWNYGFEKKSLIGKPVDFCIPEIERRVKEALLQDDRITAVENFQFEVNKKKVLTTFTVISIFGPIFTEMEVET